MRIEYYRYSLNPKLSLGAVAQPRPRWGALLKVVFSEEKVGYADCHPWPELGDLSLEDQLQQLRVGELTSLTGRSLQMAKVDAVARSLNQSVWEGLSIPSSHVLVTDWSQLTPESLNAWKKAGFEKIKLKVGKSPIDEANGLNRLASELKYHRLQLRLDFNSTLIVDEFERFLDRMGAAQECLDFVEDPFPYEANAWKRFQENRKIRLALDWIPKDMQSEVEPGSCAVLILKPASQDPRWAVSLAQSLGASLVVTSYLDHPLGQLGAAWVASQICQDSSVRLETCGLLSHTAYQDDLWTQQLRISQSYLVPPTGPGFGMGKELQESMWQPLGEFDDAFESRLAIL